MSYVEDPDYRQIRKEFLAYVRQFHLEQDYSLDWRELCERRGIKVTAATSNQHMILNGQPLITYDASEPYNRQTFTGLHELCHDLFRRAEEQFQALLGDKYPEHVSRDMEERLCNEAASLLLVPDYVLEKALTEHGYHPRAVFELCNRAGSLAACLMRVLLSHDLKAWGLIMKRDGVVEFSCTNTIYSLGRDHVIEQSHKIHDSWCGALELRAALPYRSQNRDVRPLMRADADNRRVVALFAHAFPAENRGQVPIF